ncbi:MAG: hypothetical protein AUH86_16370 [Acidobacteria bacterium 13_1_40CM_4_58_4]|nr:MAG: hypothetical protein AUH86_16370 [Acidobacteria bacterium 13_1_40CM_4_58_4]
MWLTAESAGLTDTIIAEGNTKLRRTDKAAKDCSSTLGDTTGRKAIKNNWKILQQFGTFDFDPNYNYKAERHRKCC